MFIVMFSNIVNAFIIVFCLIHSFRFKARKILAGEDCLLRQAVEALAQQVLTGGLELDGTLLMDSVEELALI